MLKKITQISSSGRPAGFTLVELIIVICIVSIMAGAVSFGVASIDRDSRLSNAANRALADLRYAQEVAMSERREVNFNIGSTGYTVTYQGGGSVVSAYDPTEVMACDFNVREYKGVTITSAVSGRLSFTSTGAPMLNGAALAATTSVMTLNSRATITMYSSGMSELFSTGGGGC